MTCLLLNQITIAVIGLLCCSNIISILLAIKYPRAANTALAGSAVILTAFFIFYTITVNSGACI